MKQFCVYMMTNKRNGTLYTGVTSDLIKRVYQHKTGEVEGFTRKYDIKDLVWYEMHENHESAIKRESNIKAWKRNWKLELIEKMNPEWKDLYNNIIGLDSSLRWNDEGELVCQIRN